MNTPVSFDYALLHPDTTYVVWATPWPGLDEHGNEVVTNVEERILVADAIKCARAVIMKYRFDTSALKHSDYNLLADFIANHWGTLEKNE